MDRRKLMLLVGALVIALGTAFLARSLFLGSSTPAAKAEADNMVVANNNVLVATRSLPVGTIITPDSLRYQPWPEDLIADAYYIEGAEDTNLESLFGTVVRNAITAGQPVTQGSLVRPGDRGFLAAALGPGMRAITVPVSARTGVAGFVFPGDRVDLMLTQTVDGDGPSLKTTETIIRNLRVLATDQRVSAEDEEGDTVVRTFRTVTVEATPQIAEKIAVAQTIGTLSLALRSIADNEAELERAIAAGEVKLPKGDDPRAEERFLKAYASRPVDSDTTFVTGGDVSRFQRKTIPPQSRSGGGGGDNIAPAASAPPRGNANPFDEKPKGPMVRVSRGKSVTEVPVGGN